LTPNLYWYWGKDEVSEGAILNERGADCGYCAARKMNYFGYKVVMLSTLSTK